MSNRKYAVQVISGGSGCQAMMSVITRDLAKKYDKVYTISHNKYWFDVLSAEIPNIVSCDYNQMPQIFATVMENPDEWDFFNDKPYVLGDFAMRRLNFYDGLRKLYGLPIRNTSSKDGSVTDFVEFNAVPENIKKSAQEFANQHPNFVLVQFWGGQNPVSGQQTPQGIMRPPYNELNNRGFKRWYDIDKATKLVSYLKEMGYEVIQYCLANEPHVEGCTWLQQEQNQLFYYEISKYCKFVVTIDSSLMHLAIKNAPKTFVIWGHTSSSFEHPSLSFGYDKAINIKPAVYKPVATFFAGLADSPVMEMASPETVRDIIKKEMNEE